MPSKARFDFGRGAMLVGLMVLGVFGWNWVPLLPFKLLAVMGHETGHALASLLVGGEVSRVTIQPTEAGECLSAVPDAFFAKVTVYSAGYVGASLISALLLIATFRFKLRRVMLGAASAWLLLMGVFYARDPFTLVFCAVMGLGFGAAARFLPQSWAEVLNLFVAAFTSLYAAMDLKDDLWNGAVRVHSDAQLLADLTVVPAVVWAGLWTLVSLVILLSGAWFALQKKEAPVLETPLKNPLRSAA
ncbi:MAG: M50 family metallopeptidase [Myxococcaceae bacterium]